MFKRLGLMFVGVIIISTVFFAAGSIASGTGNIPEWPQDTRNSVSICWSIVTLVICISISTAKESYINNLFRK